MTGFYFIILFVIAIKIVAYQKKLKWSKCWLPRFAAHGSPKRLISVGEHKARSATIDCQQSRWSWRSGAGGRAPGGKCWQRYCRRKKSFSLSLSFLLSPTTLHAALKLWTGWCGHSNLDPLLCKHCFRRPVAGLYPNGNDYEGEEGRGWAGLCVMAKCDWVHNTLEACRLLFSCLWSWEKSWSVKRLLHVIILLAFC